MLYYYCCNFLNGQPDFPNMLILKKVWGGVPQYPLATARAVPTKKLSFLEEKPRKNSVSLYSVLYETRVILSTKSYPKLTNRANCTHSYGKTMILSEANIKIHMRLVYSIVPFFNYIVLCILF